MTETVIITVLLGAVLWLGLAYNGAVHEVNSLSEELVKIQEGLESSKNVIRGQINEELAPLFPDFPYSLKDCKFLSAPIDYIVFNGMSAGEDIEIIIVDVKTGKSALTKRQQAIKKAIAEGKVRFEVWRIENNQLKVK